MKFGVLYDFRNPLCQVPDLENCIHRFRVHRLPVTAGPARPKTRSTQQNRQQRRTGNDPITNNWRDGTVLVWGGAVSLRSQPTTIGLCQCDRCQRQSGSAFLIGVIFPKEAVTIEGTLAAYEAKVDSQHRLWRHFCQTCGSAMSITLD